MAKAAYSITITCYLYLAYGLLIQVAGIGWCDGGGCGAALGLPGFRPPGSTLIEYDTLRVQLLYRIPHFVIALLFTLEALAASAIMDRFPKLRTRRITAMLLSLVFLSSGPLVSDFGSAIGVWREGGWFAWNDPGWMFFFFPLPVLLPLAVLAPMIRPTTAFLTTVLAKDSENGVHEEMENGGNSRPCGEQLNESPKPTRNASSRDAAWENSPGGAKGGTLGPPQKTHQP
jgi:hypothetical protein